MEKPFLNGFLDGLSLIFFKEFFPKHPQNISELFFLDYLGVLVSSLSSNSSILPVIQETYNRMIIILGISNFTELFNSLKQKPQELNERLRNLFIGTIGDTVEVVISDPEFNNSRNQIKKSIVSEEDDSQGYLESFSTENRPLDQSEIGRLEKFEHEGISPNSSLNIGMTSKEDKATKTKKFHVPPKIQSKTQKEDLSYLEIDQKDQISKKSVKKTPESKKSMGKPTDGKGETLGKSKSPVRKERKMSHGEVKPEQMKLKKTQTSHSQKLGAENFKEEVSGDFNESGFMDISSNCVKFDEVMKSLEKALPSGKNGSRRSSKNFKNSKK